jgi:hypothetical protein
MNDIDDYIRTNRERFAREALDEKLRAAGHDEAAIEAAWARVEAGQVSGDAGGEAQTIGPGARLAALLLILVAVAGYGYIGLFGIAGISFTASYDHAADGSTGVRGLYSVVMLAYVVAMLVGLGFSIRALWRAPRIRGTGVAVIGALGLAILLLLGINGACFVATYAAGAAT